VNGAEFRMPVPENVYSAPEDCAGAAADEEAAARLAVRVTVTVGAGAAAAVTVTVAAGDGVAVFPAAPIKTPASSRISPAAAAIKVLRTR
jgi:hypothetical protein